jgi:hypothetical protein
MIDRKTGEIMTQLMPERFGSSGTRTGESGGHPKYIITY